MQRPRRMEEIERDPDGRRRSPSAIRNRTEILPVLARVLGDASHVLEVASGTGEHAVFFARELSHVTWQPSETDEEALRSIRAWTAREQLPNVRPPIELDLESEPWPVAATDAVVAINLLHIAPWTVTEALVRGAARVLGPDGLLFLYGAMFRRGHEREPSNLAFDAQLRELDPGLGVRQLEDVEALADTVGLSLDEVVEMPNRNLAVVFRRRGE